MSDGSVVISTSHGNSYPVELLEYLSEQENLDGFWYLTEEDKHCWFSPKFCHLLGYNSQSLKPGFGQFIALLHPEDKEDVVDTIKRVLKEHGAYEIEYRLQKKNGDYTWFHDFGVAIEKKDTSCNGILGSIRNIDHRSFYQQTLEMSLTSIDDGIVITNEHGSITFVNSVAEQLLTHGDESLQGMKLDDYLTLHDEESRQKVKNPVASCISKRQELSYKEKFSFKSGKDHKHYSVNVTLKPALFHSNKVRGVVVFIKDTTDTRNMARDLFYQAAHDPLTSLVNRREFELRIQRVLVTAKSEKNHHALCYLDLDQFKVINDTCGHTAGDELLRQISLLLEGNVRKRDTVARLGGDEFGVLMEHCSLEQAQRVASKLRNQIHNYRFVWEDLSFQVGVSIGLVPINAASEGLEGILRSADAACYAAKDAGRNRVNVYRDDDEELNQRHGEMQWVTRVGRALDDNKLFLYFQDITPLRHEKSDPPMVEILLRMRENNRLFYPAQFLPAAERYGLFPQVDRYVLDNFIQWFEKNHNVADVKQLYSINLSGVSISHIEFQEYLLKKLAVHPHMAAHICFEITETSAIANLARAINFFNLLKQKGCSLALDDFGAGLSSFAYLKELPVDYLKIDGQFIKDLDTDPIALPMVKSINELSHVMGKKTIAEHVESPDTMLQLKKIGVDYVQGYHLGKPASMQNFPGRIN